MKFGESFGECVSPLSRHLLPSAYHWRSTPTVSRGVRQGCSLSPLLYLVMAVTIACAVRQNTFIHGYPIPQTCWVKICQHTDDTTIVVLSDASIREVFARFRRYLLASGARLNVDKSHGQLFGSWQGCTDLPVALDWSSSHLSHGLSPFK